MFEHVVRSSFTGSPVASEHPAGYDARPTLDDALATVDRALARLAAVDLDAEDDRALLDAAVTMQRHHNRFDGLQLRVIEAVDRRDAALLDGAVSTAAWLRTRTRQAPAEVAQQVKAAQRTRHLPALRRALLAGDVTLRHVTAVTRAAVPRGSTRSPPSSPPSSTSPAPPHPATSPPPWRASPTPSTPTAATPSHCAPTGPTNAAT